MIRFDYMRTLSDKAWIQFYYVNRRYFKLGPKDFILWLGEEMPGTLEPKKPYKYRTEGDMSQDVYDCRECGTVITLNDTYCRRCGRVQIWED